MKFSLLPLLLSPWLLCLPARADGLPLLGLAHVGIRVSDLEKARAFYHGVCGFEEAYDAKTDGGNVSAAYFKVNDLQFIAVFPGLQPGEAIALNHLAIRTDQIEKLHRMLADLGLDPSAVRKDPDGSLGFSISRLPGQALDHLEFVQYVPGSLAPRTAGKFLGDRRLSTHLEHAGILTMDYPAAYDFYIKTLGFQDRYRRLTFDRKRVVIDQLRMPGPNVDFVELSNQAGISTPAQWKRGNAHFALEVPDAAVLYQEAAKRGAGGNRKPPRYGWDNRYNVSLFDPDGTRVEFMQSEDRGHPTPLVVYTPQE